MEYLLLSFILKLLQGLFMNKKIMIITLISCIFIVSCSTMSNSAQSQNMYMQMPEHISSMPDIKKNRLKNKGSLFNRGKKPIFGDRKAMRVNDLVTIVISETANSSTQASKQLDDSSTYAMSGGIFGAKDNQKSDSLAGVLSELNNLSNLKFDSSSTNKFAGSGTNTRNESFSTNITARIMKAMVNDTYYIKGSRELLINGEHQYVSISGTIRADDISSNNIINSKYISDAKIYYATKGSVAVSSKLPWGTNVLRNIWPF